MSEPSGEFNRVQSELLGIGNDIRQLKADAAKDKDATEQLSQQIQDIVQKLNQLKDQYKEIVLEEIHRLETNSKTEEVILRVENLLPSSIVKQRQKDRKRLQKKQQTHKEHTFDALEGVQGITCQRKIHSLMDHQGQGDTFCYYPRLNSAVPFSEGEEVYLTEKMDGTTMQATKDGVYKRFERTQKSKKWHGLSEEERYRVERVDLTNRSHRYIARAINRYLPVFETIPDGVCIYFEAIDPSIGTRFQELKGFDSIYVFDSARNGEFVSFGETVELCQTLGLPCVAHSRIKLSLPRIIQTLSQTNLYYSAVSNALLEGYVVRSINTSDAAKIRVDDIPNINDMTAQM
eukprot:scaffold4162_cov162-Amphora_coffeaeformis.AAC.2